MPDLKLREVLQVQLRRGVEVPQDPADGRVHRRRHHPRQPAMPKSGVNNAAPSAAETAAER